MVSFKVLIVAAVAIACVMAEEPERVKKDVVVGAYPYVHTYGYDDGKYYPGKYEKPTFVPGVTAYSGAYPYSVGAYPYSVGAYPYAYGAYPYARQVVY